jgi:hypothetical protein
MTDRPIPFRAPMIRALREGRKTQTRRAISRLRRFGTVTEFGPSNTRGYDWHFRDKQKRWHDLRHEELLAALPYSVGDRLWVREAHYLTDDGENEYPIYAADAEALREHLKTVESMRVDPRMSKVVAAHARLRAAMHMHRWASRATLIVTNVRVQRLQDISPEDVTAEGIETWPHAAFDFAKGVPQPGYRFPNGGFGAFPGAHLQAFEMLWDTLHGPDAWSLNPWVAAITFRTILANIDAPEALARDLPALCLSGGSHV